MNGLIKPIMNNKINNILNTIFLLYVITYRSFSFNFLLSFNAFATCSAVAFKILPSDDCIVATIGASLPVLISSCLLLIAFFS